MKIKVWAKRRSYFSLYWLLGTSVQENVPF
jgi:hypothetical protein